MRWSLYIEADRNVMREVRTRKKLTEKYPDDQSWQCSRKYRGRMLCGGPKIVISSYPLLVQD